MGNAEYPFIAIAPIAQACKLTNSIDILLTASMLRKDPLSSAILPMEAWSAQETLWCISTSQWLPHTSSYSQQAQEKNANYRHPCNSKETSHPMQLLPVCTMHTKLKPWMYGISRYFWLLLSDFILGFSILTPCYLAGLTSWIWKRQRNYMKEDRKRR